VAAAAATTELYDDGTGQRRLTGPKRMFFFILIFFLFLSGKRVRSGPAPVGRFADARLMRDCGFDCRGCVAAEELTRGRRDGSRASR
jgi:hypothetical protein